MNEEVEFYDKIGQRLHVGDYIVYGHALGRCAALKIGKILNLGQAERYPYAHRSNERISVVGIEYSRRNPETNKWEPDREFPYLTKAGTLQFPDRTVVLDPTKVPQDVKDLLDSFVPAEKKGKKKVKET